jgi:GxxExxY protein
MPLIFCEMKMDLGYRVDLLVEDEIIVEIKAVESLNDVHPSSPWRLSNCNYILVIFT